MKPFRSLGCKPQKQLIECISDRVHSRDLSSLVSIAVLAILFMHCASYLNNLIIFMAHFFHPLYPCLFPILQAFMFCFTSGSEL